LKSQFATSSLGRRWWLKTKSPLWLRRDGRLDELPQNFGDVSNLAVVELNGVGQLSQLFDEFARCGEQAAKADECPDDFDVYAHSQR
jgi:hypothetical protein